MSSPAAKKNIPHESEQDLPRQQTEPEDAGTTSPDTRESESDSWLRLDCMNLDNPLHPSVMSFQTDEGFNFWVQNTAPISAPSSPINIWDGLQGTVLAASSHNNAPQTQQVLPDANVSSIPIEQPGVSKLAHLLAWVESKSSAQFQSTTSVKEERKRWADVALCQPNAISDIPRPKRFSTITVKEARRNILGALVSQGTGAKKCKI